MPWWRRAWWFSVDVTLLGCWGGSETHVPRQQETTVTVINTAFRVKWPAKSVEGEWNMNSFVLQVALLQPLALVTLAFRVTHIPVDLPQSPRAVLIKSNAVRPSFHKRRTLVLSMRWAQFTLMCMSFWIYNLKAEMDNFGLGVLFRESTRVGKLIENPTAKSFL